MHGHTSVVYVNDSYLQGDSYESCLKNLNDTIIMFRSLGFTIHPEKSVLISIQNLTLNSKDMTFTMTEKTRNL